MRGIKLLMLVSAFAVAVLASTPSPGHASWCAKAEEAGWYHPGLNGLCALEIWMEITDASDGFPG